MRKALPGDSRNSRLAALVCCLALLVGCASAPAKPAIGEANDVLFGALGLVGTPYHWGGNTPASGFDCSGLVTYVYRHTVGLVLPRTSREMSKMDVPHIKPTQLTAGDLLFFRGNGRNVDHVAIYVGKGRFVHAPTSGGKVRLDQLDNPYWSQHFAYARRPLSNL